MTTHETAAYGGERVQEYAVDPMDLGVDRAIIERGMGYLPDRAPSIVSELIDDVLHDLPTRCAVRCGFVVLPAEDILLSRESLSCNGVMFRTGPVIAKPLSDCATITLFVATIGPYLERWSRQLMRAGDTLKGYIVDSAASDVVERAADWLEHRVQADMGEHGWRTSNRYSPGYCGWPVEDQHRLFSLLPEDFCGITLNESALMNPMKSVSGIIGVGPAAKRSDYQCKICDREDCYRRREEDLPAASTES